MKKFYTYLAVFLAIFIALGIFFGDGRKTGPAALSGVPAEYRTDVEVAGNICPQISSALIAAQIRAESNWNPNAVSPAGAQGIAQFMPLTWFSVGTDGDGDGKADPLNPHDAIHTQGKYMCDQAAQIQSYLDAGKIAGDLIELTLAAYNAGIGNILAFHGLPPFPETQAYIQRITASLVAPAAGVVEQARNYEGVPYVWGSTDPSVGLDCSGLVVRVFADLSQPFTGGVRTADQIIHSDQVHEVSRDEMQPGDLIGFSNRGSSHIWHIGIVSEDGKMIHAPEEGQPVKEANLSNSFWQGLDWHIVRKN